MNLRAERYIWSTERAGNWMCSRVTKGSLTWEKRRKKTVQRRSVEGIATMRNAILLICLAISGAAQEEPTLTWIFLSEPIYPQMARIAHIFGPVTMEITIQPNGEFAVSKATGPPILVQAAKDSIQKSKLKCEGCGDKEHTFPIVYQFKIEDPPPPSTPVAEVPLVRRQRERSIRCMYLWKCGSIWFY